MKILIVTGIFPPDIGGPASYVPAIAEALKERGHSLQIITLSDSVCQQDDIYSFPVVRITRSSFRPNRVLKTVLKIIELGRNADLLFVHGLAFEAVLANFIIKKPFVQKIVGDLAWERARTFEGIKETLDVFQDKKYGIRIETVKRLRKYWVKKSSMIITPSSYLKKIVLGWGVNSEKIKVIYNAVDPGGAGEDSVSDELITFSLSKKKIVSVGRLVSWKGFEGLIHVVADIPDVCLIIIGEGPQRGDLEKLIKEKNLNEKVKLMGARPRDEVFSCLKSSDLFVLNSSYEGLPHIVLEAMSVFVPVIATDTGGTGELVENEYNGLLVQPGDREGLKNSINRLIHDNRLQKKLVKNGEETVGKFNWEKLVNETETILLQSIKGL